MPSKGFQKHRLDIGKICSVFEVRETIVAHYPIDLFLSLSLYLRVQHHSKNEDKERAMSLYNGQKLSVG